MRTLVRMLRTPDTISTLRHLLTACRTIAVVGLSPQWHRPSYFAAKYMQAHGYRIVPVNPLVAREGGQILGETAYASVTEAAAALAAQGQKIDMVDCFRKSEDIPPLADEAIAIGARCLWLQLGVFNEAARQRAEALRHSLEEAGIAHRGSDSADVLTMSIGVACLSPDSQPELSQLYEQADRALYEAKAFGRNRVAA